MTITRSLGIAVAAATLAVLAPTPASAQFPGRQPANQLRGYDGVDVPGSRVRVLLDTLAVWEKLPASPAEVYAKVRLVLGVLKMPYTRADSVGGLIFNEGFVARSGRLAGRPASASLRCGFGPTGDYADSWRVTVQYAVFIQPSDSANARLGIAVLGEAKDIAGTGSATMPCVSTGKLEYDITQLVRN